MPNDDAIEFPLLENGLDFIWSAIEHLTTGATKRDLKYAVLHLGAGVELVLKERLRRENWKLLFENQGKASEETYRSGAFPSVRFDTCLERLAAECGVELTDEDEARLRAIRDKRNRLEHLALVDSAEAIIAVTARALAVMLDFVREELAAIELSGAEDAVLSQIRAKLPEFDAFVADRSQSIAPKLKAAYRVLPCPACLQDALSVDDGVSCLFCGYTNDGTGAAVDYTTEVLGVNRYDVEKDGADWPIGFCPACDWEACVDADDRGYLCFHCGETWGAGDFHECGHCGRWIDSDLNDISVCDQCFERQMQRDD